MQLIRDDYLLELSDAEVYIISATDNTICNTFDSLDGEIKTSLRLAVDRDETRKQAIRTKERHSTKAAQGYWCGGIPVFGYARMEEDADGRELGILQPGTHSREGNRVRIVLDDEEKVKAARRVFEMYARENASLRKIARWLNDQGFRTSRGNEWKPNTLSDMFRNRIYRGDLIYGKRNQGGFSRGENIWHDSQKSRFHDEGNWTVRHDDSLRIVDEMLWNVTQARIASGKHGTYEGPKRKPKFLLLSGLIYCEKCGDKYYQQVEPRGKRLLERYRDHNRARMGPCKKGAILAKPLHDFAERIINDSVSQTLIQEAIQVARETLKAESGIDTKIQSRIVPEIQRLEKQRSNLIRYLKDVPYSQFLAEELAIIEDQIGQMEDMRSRLSEDCTKELAILAQIEAGALDFAEMWAKGTPEARQKVARAIIRKIVISEDHDTAVWEYFPLPLGGVESVRADGGTSRLWRDKSPPTAGANPNVRVLFSIRQVNCAEGGTSRILRDKSRRRRGESPRPCGHRILSYTHPRREIKMCIQPVSGKKGGWCVSPLLQQ
ncbi:MAG: recombinase family protein [Desulfobacterales bacterium]|nr:recombinase family protein [Desulfobacterales bacterium]